MFTASSTLHTSARRSANASRLTWAGCALLFLLVCAFALLPAQAAQAQGGFVVNDSGDAGDPDVGTDKDDHACDTAFTDQNGAIVNNGICTLRAAIQNANFVGGGSISFNGGMTITPGPVLPRLTAPISIDGGGNVTLDGVNAYGGDTIFDPVGLGVYAPNCTIRGMKIVRFATGIRLASSAGNNVLGDNALIEDNAIGDTGMGNSYGLFVDSSNNTIQNNSITGNRTGVYVIYGAGNLLQSNAITYNGVQGGVIGGNQYIVYAQDGVIILDSTYNTVFDNVISGNGRHGVAIQGYNNPAHHNIVRSNRIGVDEAGEIAVPNGQDGVYVGSDDNTIGGPAPEDGNIISGNGRNGILMGNSRNLIQNNRIGVNAAGAAAIGNASDGINLSSGGGSNSILSNLISGNGGNGIDLAGSGQTNEIVQSNIIGASADGTAAIGNALNGIRVGVPNSQIGGVGVGNLISGNGGHGILLAAAGNTVRDNRIGVDAAATAALGNSGDGIYLADASNNTMQGNIIGGNGGNGFYAMGDNSGGNSFKGNFVGTNTDRSAALGNGLNGVHTVSSNTVIGGPSSAEGNLIANNNGDGIIFESYGNNRARGNGIYNNGELGIDLGNDGVGINDLNDADINLANQGQNYPVLVSASSGQPVIDGTYFGASSQSFDLDFFASSQCDASGYGEGEFYLGSLAVTTSNKGYANFSFSAASSVPDGWFVTATATAITGNGVTSEFSQCLLVPTTGNIVRWVNPAGGIWNNPNNWAPAVVPQAPHNAQITLDGDYTVELNIDADIHSLTLGGESGVQTLLMPYNGFGGYGLTLNAPSVIASNGVLSLQEGGFFDNGGLINESTLTVDGRFDWLGGKLRGGGETIIGNNGQLAVSGGTLDGQTLTNNGAVSLGANVFNTSLFLENDPTINNNGLFELSGSIRTNPPGSPTTAQFNNSGALRLVGFSLGLELTPQVNNGGLVAVGDNSSVVFPNGYVQSAGELRLDNGSIYRNSYGTDDMIIDGGLVTGNGNIFANLINNGGVVSPGNSPGRLVMRGYQQGSGGALTIELAGRNASQFSPDFDYIDVSYGNATLDGTLNISTINDFSTSEGDSFRIISADSISGQFATVNSPDLGNGEQFQVNYHSDSVTVSHGDEPPPAMDLGINLSPSNYAVDPGAQLTYYLSISNYQPGNGGGGGGDSFASRKDGQRAAQTANQTSNQASNQTTSQINSSQNVVVNVQLPAGVTFLAANTTQGECTTPAVGETGAVTCALGEVFQSYEGASVYLSIDVQVAATSGNLIATASVSSDTPDSDLDNNSAETVVSVNSTGNNPPTADDQAIGTDEDSAASITLTGSDIDGDSLSFSVVDQPQHGTLSGIAPDLTYTPAADFNGSDSFTFVANDGQVDSNPATVSITVNPINDVAAVNDQSVSTDEDSTASITLTGSDIDGDSLSFSVVDQPQQGTLSGIAPDLTYTPAANFDGSDSFTFVANDGQADSNLATVSITVNPINDNPIAVDDSANTAQNTAVTIGVLGNDTDVDGDSLTISAVGNASHGAATSDGAAVSYTPNAGFSGADSFVYTVSDGNGGSATATVNVTVAAGSAQPVITIVLDSQPDKMTNIRFDGTAPIKRFRLDDITPQDNDAFGASRSFAVEPGSYTVIETVPGGWFLTGIVCTPNANTVVDLNSKQVTLTVDNGDNVTCTFVNQKAATIRATLFHDLNGNGTRQGKEPFNTGWTVNLLDSQNALAATEVSNNQGKVSFTNVRPGAYTVCEVLQNGLTNPQPCRPVQVDPDQTATLLFANVNGGASAASAGQEDAVVTFDNGADKELSEDAYAMPPNDDAWLNSEEQAVEESAGKSMIFLPVVQR